MMTRLESQSRSAVTVVALDGIIQFSDISLVPFWMGGTVVYVDTIPGQM